jgi:cell division protein FtsN
MTDSKSTKRTHSLDDFDKDLDAMLNEAAFSLDNMKVLQDDDDAIDRLLMDDSFNAEDAASSVGIKEKMIDDIALSEFDEFAGFDDVVDDFEQSEIVQYDDQSEVSSVSDPVSMPKTTQEEADHSVLPHDKLAEIDGLDEIVEGSVEQPVMEVKPGIQGAPREQAAEKAAALFDELDDDFLMADFDITADLNTNMKQDDEADALDEAVSALLINEVFEQNTQVETAPIDSDLNGRKDSIKQDPMVNTLSVDDSSDVATLNSLKSDQELINRQQKKLIQELDNKTRKATVMMYAALGLASVSLMAAITAGILVYVAKSESARLAEQFVALDQELKTVAVATTNNAGNDLTNVNLIVEQLNQKVDGLAGQLGELAKSATDMSQQKLTDVVTKQNLADKTIAALQRKVDILEKKKTAEAPVKPATDKVATQQPVKLNASTIKIAPQKAPLTTAADWTVNLLALREKDDANSKAAEFAKKGVPVEVIEVKVNRQTWYRLRVSGFSNQDEATAYAGRAKNALNLNSVWVTKN